MPKVTRTVNMDADDNAWLKIQAVNEDRTVSGLLRRLVREERERLTLTAADEPGLPESAVERVESA